jgi:hypothetical protein
MAAGKGAWIAVAALAAGAAGGRAGAAEPRYEPRWESLDRRRQGQHRLLGRREGLRLLGPEGHKPGTYEVEVAYSCAAGAEGSELVVAVGGASVTGTSKPTGSWATFTTEKLGMLAIDRAGTHTLTVKPKAPPPWKVIGLKSVTLVPR